MTDTRPTGKIAYEAPAVVDRMRVETYLRISPRPDNDV
jgi:hypothetical protein